MTLGCVVLVVPVEMSRTTGAGGCEALMMAEDGEVITICNSVSRVILSRSFTCGQALFF